jgi:hypothetical protein
VTIKGVFGFIAMRLVRELLNDVSVDMNMDVTHAESYTHNRQTRRRKKGRKHTLRGSRENKHKTTKQGKENREAPSVASAVVYRVLRLFKAGDEDPARGAGIKVEEYAAPPPIDETQHHTPQADARHNFNKKTAEAINHWGG